MPVHIELRKKLIEDNRLDGIVSMPAGVFRPYAGVSTAVLLFTRGAKTEDVWFYDMVNDGFSLDDKRVPLIENDIPDVLLCWKSRFDKEFRLQREYRVAELEITRGTFKEGEIGITQGNQPVDFRCCYFTRGYY